MEKISKENYRISVILPVYSETDSVKGVVSWLETAIERYLEEIIIVISPRSTEESRITCAGLVNQYKNVKMHVQVNNPGLGHAVREGYAIAKGNLMLNMDSDGEMENETVIRMIDEMAAKKCRLVVASRWLKNSGFVGYSPLKYVLNWLFQQFFRIIFRTKIHDLTYGFKLIDAELAKNIEWQGTLHEIACETTLKPVRLGISVSEVNTRWTARVKGTSKNSFMKNFRYVFMAWNILQKGVNLKASKKCSDMPLENLRKIK